MEGGRGGAEGGEGEGMGGSIESVLCERCLMGW